MIHFVLHEFRERAGRFEQPRFARLVLIPDGDGSRALHVDQQIRERKTVVPEPDLLLALPLEAGIHQGVGHALKLEVNDTLQFADLDRADAPAEPVRALELVKRIPEIAKGQLCFGRAGNRIGHGPQQRVAELKDSACRHGPIVAIHKS